MSDNNRNKGNNRAEIQRKRNKRRQEELARKKKIMTIAAAAAVVIVVIIILVNVLGSGGKGDSSTSEDTITLVETDLSDLKLMAFDPLSITDSDTKVSVSQFEDIIKDLYQQNYCLVDLYDIAYVDTDGGFAYKDTITFPEGKKPLVIIETNASYPYDADTQGISEKMLVEDGDIVTQYSLSNGTTETGNYDIVPIIESFVKSHPDFSYDGARGIIGLSGECGILGYRISSYLAKEDDNPYAEYGLADTKEETEAAGEVVQAVKDAGWHFASNGYRNDISYGSEISIMTEDVENWTKEVGSIVEDTDIIILPKATDVGSWAAYQDTNEKYSLLKENGFSYYLLEQNTTPYMLQIRDGYVRMTYYKINTSADYNSALTASSVSKTQDALTQETTETSSQQSEDTSVQDAAAQSISVQDAAVQDTAVQDTAVQSTSVQTDEAAVSDAEAQSQETADAR